MAVSTKRVFLIIEFSERLHEADTSLFSSAGETLRDDLDYVSISLFSKEGFVLNWIEGIQRTFKAEIILTIWRKQLTLLNAIFKRWFESPEAFDRPLSSAEAGPSVGDRRKRRQQAFLTPVAKRFANRQMSHVKTRRYPCFSFCKCRPLYDLEFRIGNSISAENASNRIISWCQRNQLRSTNKASSWRHETPRRHLSTQRRLTVASDVIRKMDANRPSFALIFALVFVFVQLKTRQTESLSNGVALTPPMGWLSWIRFGCNTRCDIDPENCIR